MKDKGGCDNRGIIRKMIVTIVGWAIGTMVFFKIAMDASFVRDVSLVGALILGAMTGISVYVGSAFYATKMGEHFARVKFGANV